MSTKERQFYTKQMEEICEEGKKFVTVSSLIIDQTSDDSELGKIVREMMKKKIVDCEEHVRHMKSI